MGEDSNQQGAADPTLNWPGFGGIEALAPLRSDEASRVRTDYVASAMSATRADKDNSKNAGALLRAPHLS